MDVTDAGAVQAGIVSRPGEAYYAASKNALRGFLESLHHEVTPQGVRVALVEPGFIATELARGAAPERPTWRRATSWPAKRGPAAT
jgi:short-subunit dehydrogenase